MGTPAREATSSHVNESIPSSTSTSRAELNSAWYFLRDRSWLGYLRGNRISVPGSSSATGVTSGLGSLIRAFGQLDAQLPCDETDMPLRADVVAGPLDLA